MRTTMSVILGLTIAAASALHVAQAADRNGTSPAAKPGSVAAPKPGPKKGVIFIKTKRFYSCTDWGKDKGTCKKL